MADLVFYHRPDRRSGGVKVLRDDFPRGQADDEQLNVINPAA